MICCCCCVKNLSNIYSKVHSLSLLPQQFRHKVLGFEHRTHTILSDGTYYYGDKEGKSINHGYSLLISANIILHKKYLEMFQVPLFLPIGIHKYIDEHMNCEDIAICLMVTDFLERVSFPQSGCIGLRAKRYPQNLEAKNRKYTNECFITIKSCLSCLV